MSVELTERQESILSFVVHHYIQHAQPVGSRTVVQKSNLKFSSATIRHEMATLEEAGLLVQPHTSAGRTPTEAGYRYFVERLMGRSELSEAEQRLIRHQFHQARLDIEQWIKLAVAVLAHTTKSASLITMPLSNRCHVKHVELIGISERLVLTVLILQDGLVKQQLVRTLSAPLTQEYLNAIASKLNANFGGLDCGAIINRPIALTLFENRVREAIAEMMQQVDQRSITELYRDGLIHILRKPEFVQAKPIRQIVSILEQRSLLDQIATEIRETQGVQVIIGGEGRWREISEVSLVMAPYGAGDAAGIMGVVGPMRMSYGRAISVVRFMSGLMSHLLSDIYLSNRELVSPEITTS